MSTETLLLAKLLGGDSKAVPYRPELAKQVGGIAPAILLQQVVFRWNGQGQKAFYKFKEPCNHHLYKEGDSWLEELGFSRREFDNAIKEIGFKNTQETTQDEAYQSGKPVVYWTAPDRVTYYTINLDALIEVLAQAYNVPLKYESDFTKSTDRALDQKNDSDFRRSEKENTPQIPVDDGTPSKLSFSGGYARCTNETPVTEYIEVQVTPFATSFYCPSCNLEKEWPSSKTQRRKKKNLTCADPDCGVYFEVSVESDYGGKETYKFDLPTDEWIIKLDKYPALPKLICDKKEVDRFISNWGIGQELMEDKIAWALGQAWWLQQQGTRVSKLNAAFDTSYTAWERAQSARPTEKWGFDE